MMWRKNRSKFGEWFDKEQEDYNQTEFAKEIGINKDTMTKACSDDDWIPSPKVMKKIISAVKKIDSSKRASDFWDM